MMRFLKLYFYFSLVVLFSMVACSQSQVLFEENGAGWNANGDATWEFKHKELTGIVSDGAGFVISNQLYSDYLLELEFKPDSTINSGVFIHCSKEEINAKDCYELNIWDFHPNKEDRTGAIVQRQAPYAYVETIGKWNTYRIRAEKNRIQVWVNNVLTAEATNDDLYEGYIGLQAKGTGVISFRNIVLKNLNVD